MLENFKASIVGKPIQTNNIAQDRYDSTVFNELLNASGTLQNVMETPPIAQEPWKAMVQDVWAGYYKFKPELAPEKEVTPIYLVNRAFIEKFLEDPATEDTRIYTKLDELSAGIATVASVKTLNDELNNRPDLKEKFDQFFKAQEENGSNEETAGRTAQQMIEDLSALGRDVRLAIKQATDSGKKEAETFNDNLRGWGLKPDDLKNVPMAKRLELADYLTKNPRLKNLSKIIGRFRNLAKSRQNEKVNEKRDEIHSITLGNDLAHVLPSELAALNHPVLKLDFYRKFSEGSLLQYELKTNEPKGRGPIVAAIDISGSMGEMGGAPLDLAIATALSLVDTANRQKRKSYIIFFNTEIKKEIEFNPNEKNNIDKILEIAQIGASGGTKYEPALEKSLELICNGKYKKADLVFITDGICKVEPEFIDRFNKLKSEFAFRCYSILIGFQSEELKKWSDQIWAVSKSGIDETTAGELFEAVY